MNALIQLINISFAHGEKQLFDQLSLVINAKQKIGLVGHNGCGKSTLFSLITNSLQVDSGEVRKARHVKIGHVDQFVPEKFMNSSAVDMVVSALPTEEQTCSRWRAESHLMSLGFNHTQMNQTIQSMSGGQQNLVLIARALINEPDVLLMDEPGNHMDIKAMLTLESYLKNECKCAVMMISHDAQLLDSICDKTVFIRDQKSYEFELAYSNAKAALEKMDQDAEKRRLIEEKEIDRLQKTAKRLAVWGHQYDNEDLSRKSKSILKRVEKLEADKTFVTQGSALKLTLNDQSLAAKQVLAIDDFTVMIPTIKKALYEIEAISIKPGDRVALLGENGCGKSTLLNILQQQFAKERSLDEKIRFNPRTELGFYEQELEQLQSKESRLDWLRRNTHANEEELKRTLINAGIRFREFDREVKSLSGGEKARLMFMSFSLNQPNLLILDEPTNHIDLQGKEELTEQLMTSGATLLITSHDRQFLNNIATRWFCIQDKKLIELPEPDEFYEQLLLRANNHLDLEQPNEVEIMEAAKNEDILIRIELLEKKLAEDQKRKPKFQKPKLQQEWKVELEELWNQIK
ncbi:ABC-F family ATP-binding cassette domain-containing protein [Aliikangiella coralliicola]|uniref:ABC-F family ATP-binding cassette domain-containing protein n=1 Tax=Aliikangiella coralliicola TaxID=2592383 RepID=A0A545UJ43_9GAMM|nr:ABC-F family ATP-binding cassette domain-containing protein [Aliikangiella coralliicola]TQV89453.1 ABC-F family ATP-binding cassette domain-containing protein [Aliikangiella coralliicola]